MRPLPGHGATLGEGSQGIAAPESHSRAAVIEGERSSQEGSARARAGSSRARAGAVRGSGVMQPRRRASAVPERCSTCQYARWVRLRTWIIPVPLRWIPGLLEALPLAMAVEEHVG